MENPSCTKCTSRSHVCREFLSAPQLRRNTGSIILPAVSVFLLLFSQLATSTTLAAQTSNNTAACAAAGSPSYCQA